MFRAAAPADNNRTACLARRETTNDTRTDNGPRRGPVCRITPFIVFYLPHVDDLHALRGRGKDALAGRPAITDMASNLPHVTSVRAENAAIAATAISA